MKKIYLTLFAAMFAFGANSYAVGFAQSQANGDWSNASTWNWRNMTVDIPAEGYPNTSDTSIITHVALANNVNLDVNATAPLMFLSGTLNVVGNSTLTFTGHNNNFFNISSGGRLNVIEGKMLLSNVANNLNITSSDVQMSFGGYDVLDDFHAAKAGSFDVEFDNNSRWVGFQSTTDSSFKFYFGNSNLDTAKTAQNAIIQTNAKLAYLKTPINLDFTNVQDMDEGTYYVSLISYGNGYFTGNIDIDTVNANTTATVAEGMEFLGLEIDNSGLYAKIAVAAVPEPATCAAIFGALALAFVAYRRRK